MFVQLLKVLEHLESALCVQILPEASCLMLNSSGSVC